MSTAVGSDPHDVKEAGLGRKSDSKRAGLWSALVVAVAIVLANFSYIVGLRSNNPILYNSGLGSPTAGSSNKPFTPKFGSYTIDPNDGWTVQSLGKLSAQMWSHGHVPLWNVYEGLGQPLAGEMQSAALFLPFILFQLLPNGVFAMHLALELVAGLSTLALLRTMRLSWVAATAGGVLFALNGAFSVMTNAPFNPIAFLPLALWGVELVARNAQLGKRSRLGLWAIALSLAWMLFAGFPETALLEAFVILVWCLVRFVDLKGARRSFTLWCGAGGVLGVLLALPILVSLKGFLGFGYTAYHGGESEHWTYVPGRFAGLALYYGQGTFGHNAVASGVAGYVTLGAVALAFLGLFAPVSRVLRAALFVLVAIFALNSFGWAPANRILNAIPGMTSVLIYKYGLLVIEFGVIVLAAFGLDSILRGRVTRRAFVVSAVIPGIYLVWSVYYMSVTPRFYHVAWSCFYLTATLCVLVVVLGCAWAAMRHKKSVRMGFIAALFVGAEAVGTFAVPQITSSAPRPVDTAPIHYLQKHLGTSRFYSIGPIEANYGSYWGLSQLNVNDLPVPQKFSDFIMKSLKPPESNPLAKATGRAFIPYELSPLEFNVKYEKSLFAAYLLKQKAYQDAGVKYLVTKQGVTSSAVANKYGLTNVFSDKKVVIWEDAGVKPYYEAGEGCSVLTQTPFDATVKCSAPSTLVRRQLASPDWSVKINGQKHSVGQRADGLFQSIKLPAGTSHLEFTYIPKYFKLASGISLLVVAGMLLDGLLYLRSRRKPTV